MKNIFNILSNKRELNKNEIIVDHREKNSLVISELHSLGIKSNFKQLKVADYIVKGVAIERKTVQDFISSMINKRLLKQLEELKQYKENLLLIEGIYEQELYGDSENFGVHPNSIRGFLISIILKYKIPIIFTKNYEDTARFISVLTKRKSREVSLNVNKKSLDKKERMQFILEGFPGIGPKTAKKLLNEFGSLKNIFNSSEEDLQKVLGKKGSNIKNIIDSEY